jgi:hypothetical protein
MAALGVDLVSSLAGVTGKVITGATGTGFMAGGCQVATSITCSRIRYECGDLLDNDVCRRCGKMRLYEEGLSHGNCFCNAKFSKQS